MKTFSIVLTAAALSILLAAPAGAEAPRANAVVGEKLDSGLGELQVYPQVAGQKVDSGLGELPHYRLWTDKTGRAPVALEQVAKAATTR